MDNNYSQLNKSQKELVDRIIQDIAQNPLASVTCKIQTGGCANDGHTSELAEAEKGYDVIHVEHRRWIHRAQVLADGSVTGRLKNTVWDARLEDLR